MTPFPRSPCRLRQAVVTAALAVLLTSSAFSQPASSPELQELIALATRWTASFVETFSSVLVEERYEQAERLLSRDITKRSLRAEMLLLKLTDGPGWVHFRDVFEVGGRSVSDRHDRLQRLFLDSPSTAFRDARRLTEESSRHNLSAVIRTINVPTFGLLPLDASYAARFAFDRNGEEAVDGRLATSVRFSERRGRSLVRTLKGDDVPIEGVLWLERGTGRVLRTLVKTRGTPDPGVRPPSDGTTLMWVQTTYGPIPPSNVWGPVEMREWSRSSARVEVSGTATYANLRQFVVDTAVSYGKAP